MNPIFEPAIGSGAAGPHLRAKALLSSGGPLKFACRPARAALPLVARQGYGIAGGRALFVPICLASFGPLEALGYTVRVPSCIIRPSLEVGKSAAQHPPSG